MKMNPSFIKSHETSQHQIIVTMSLKDAGKRSELGVGMPLFGTEKF